MPSTRREFLTRSGQYGAVAAATTLPGVGRRSRAIADEPLVAQVPVRGSAEACIFIWLGGGACHLDMWDPKRRGDGAKQPGSYYDAIPTAISGANVCTHLARSAALLDRAVLVRTVHHEIRDEHAAATNRLHTGRPVSGTVIYPSLGSIVSHERGSAGDGVPPYIVMGYPNVTRGPGFLGAKYGYIYLTETAAGPTGLTRPPQITASRAARREELLAMMRTGYLDRQQGDRQIADYAAAGVEGLRLSGPRFMDVFRLDREPSELREAYGDEFGQRCLLARRLVERGVRFIEVSFNLNFLNGTGWDTHNEGQKDQHLLIDKLDRAFATLLTDLERVKWLDKTLVVIATEFGRPAEFDAGGGRGHQSSAFSIVLAGGGLRTGQVIGETDDLARTIVRDPVSVPDLHATIYAALQVDPSKELHDGERPVPITDMGQPVRRLFG
ncbi:MAG: DUF1501 domain-containing protein [Planctomycetaceae bacterium]